MNSPTPSPGLRAEASQRRLAHDAGENDSDAALLAAVSPAEPVLCGHCGRTASNGLACIGMCVADSGY